MSIPSPSSLSELLMSTPSLPPPVLPLKNYTIHVKSWRSFWMELAIMSVPLIAGYYLFKKIRKELDSTGRDNENSIEEIRAALAAKFKGTNRIVPEMDTYELKLINDIVFPEQMSVSFDDIGGLSALKDEIFETVILPLQSPELFQARQLVGPKGGKQNDLLSPPRGVLFYGPPGCGKTMMAKALAKSCKASFLNIRISTLQNKWFGESQKLVRSVFSLAEKIAPTIIFIDEIDLFLRKRSSGDHEVTASMKGEFMSLWDGLTSKNGEILVLGCTNRPFDLDEAILRRMPRQFLFPLPNQKERTSILGVLLRGYQLDRDVIIEEIAKKTERYSGSDLKELCRYAAMQPVREIIKAHQKAKTVNSLSAAAKSISLSSSSSSSSSSSDSSPSGEPRAVAMRDFEDALSVVEPTGQASYEYQKQFQKESVNSTIPSHENKFHPHIIDSSSSSSLPSSMGGGIISPDTAAAIGGAAAASGNPLFAEGTIMHSMFLNAHLWPHFLQFLQARQAATAGSDSDAKNSSLTDDDHDSDNSNGSKGGKKKGKGK